MKFHSEIITELGSKETASHCGDPAGRSLLLRAIVHSADLSSQAFPTEVSLEWYVTCFISIIRCH